jgi:hypothetical protein
MGNTTYLGKQQMCAKFGFEIFSGIGTGRYPLSEML